MIDLNVKVNLRQIILTMICLVLIMPVTKGQRASIHMVESMQYSSQPSDAYYKYEPFRKQNNEFSYTDTCQLNKIVFGYHPYWAGNAFLNYRWNLLSDLCYFSYEVDPASGFATTTNGWETSPVIDSALAHGVRVHLCITLFNGHYTFFSSQSAQDTLISQVIAKMLQRNATGVNLDVEALPSSSINAYNAFLINLATKVHTSIPGSVVSIAAPAVDWNHELHFADLDSSIDYYVVMAYDYYWNGSSQAGPVAPLYPMVSSYNYSVKQTILWYLSNHVAASKIILGVPYYGRDWPVEQPYAPSNTTGNGSALQYKTIRNNSSIYSPENLLLEPNSLAPYYSYQSGNWHQCFAGDKTSLGLAYDQLKSHHLAGVGIWALSYDDGYQELWQLIQDELTDCEVFSCTDTIYDSGGPGNRYSNNENYSQTFTHREGESLRLEFLNFDLEAGHDSLWVYDGADTLSPLLIKVTGNQLPSAITATGNKITIAFRSDGYQTSSGWKAVIKCPTASASELQAEKNDLLMFPNPTERGGFINFVTEGFEIRQITISDMNGRFRLIQEMPANEKSCMVTLPTSLTTGVYILKVFYSNGGSSIHKLLIR